jgi:aldose 1-epimerase
MDRPRPSGEQFVLELGDERAVVTEVGATLREYSAAGRQLLDGFDSAEMCSGGRGQLLLPWPNRVRDGSYQFGDHVLQVALSDVEHGHAIHGLVRWQAWRLLEQTPERVSLGFKLFPQPGYPFSLELSAGFRLAAEGLSVTVAARNVGAETAPFGAGAHPYLKPRGNLIDSSVLHVPASSYLEVDEALIPTGRRLSVEGTRFDFRRPREVGETLLDMCFTDFEEPFVALDGTRLWFDAQHPFLQVFSGDTLHRDRRRRGLAVEPMTCAPDAFNSGLGLVLLEPGQEWSGGWGIDLPPAG